MAIFYICRHGETENNKKKLLSGWVDTPLTENGLQNVQSTISKLRGIQFDRIYSSDLGRAFVTAYLISRSLGYNSEIHRLKDLREANYGDLGEMPEFDAAKQYPGVDKDTNFTPPNGESLAEMQQRVLKSVDGISKKYPKETILLASHDGPINAIYAKFADKDLGFLTSSHINPHDFVAKFVYDDDKIILFDEVLS